MAESKAKAETKEAPKAEPQEIAPEDEVAAGGGEEVQARIDEEQEKGYSGERVSPIDPSEWSLESGPDSPSVGEVRKGLNERQAEKNPDYR